MNKIILSMREIRKLEIIGMGGEAFVYNYNDKALKVFNFDCMDPLLYENKFNKLEAISKMKLDNFILPTDYIYTPDDFFLGYAMEKLNSKIDLYSYIKNNQISLKDKIDMLKKYEKLIKNAHDKNIFIVDANFWNCIIVNNKPHIIDIDSFKINDLKEDFLPEDYETMYLVLNQKKAEANQDFDKFQIGIQTLGMLIDPEIVKCNQYLKFKNIINDLDLDEISYNYFMSLLLPTKNKLYIENNLDNLQNREEVFIKRK